LRGNKPIAQYTSALIAVKTAQHCGANISQARAAKGKARFPQQEVCAYLYIFMYIYA
jgi:hypothetical protein